MLFSSKGSIPNQVSIDLRRVVVDGRLISQCRGGAFDRAGKVNELETDI